MFEIQNVFKEHKLERVIINDKRYYKTPTGEMYPSVTTILSTMTEADIRREGGRGGQEVRSWIAAFAALSELGEYEMTTQVYEAISEWIAGFGIVSAELKG